MTSNHTRNPGTPLDLDWVMGAHINKSAVERRTATLTGRRTVKKDWQAAWLLRAITNIDLVRIVIERTAMKSENIANEYSYTAPDNWDAEFRKAMKRLVFKAV